MMKLLSGLVLSLSAMGCALGGSSGVELPDSVITLSPTSGPIGTIITVSGGANFSTAQSITIGGHAGLILNASLTSLTAMVMPGSLTGSVVVSRTTTNLATSDSFTVTSTGLPNTQQGSKLVASDGAGTPHQGTVVALSADGNTAAVGAYNDNGGIGAVFVYIRATNGSWSQQGSKLIGSSAIGNANQGSYVALSADGNTLIEGGTADNSNVGAAWVFTRSGTTWTEQAKLIGTGSTGTDIFQGAVALSADGNTAIVGGYGDNSNIGAFWTFKRAGTSWAQQGSKVTPTGATGAAGMGVSVALSADGTTAAVGGPNNSSTIGATWIFKYASSAWTQQARLIANNTVSNDQQGYSVALSADGNTLLTGGPWADTDGAVWVFTRSGTTWTEFQKFTASDVSAGAQFGVSLSLSADGTTAIIGGNADTTNAGGAWYYTLSSGSWTQRGLKKVGTGANGTTSLQGNSVAISSDATAVLVGGPGDNTDVGAVWAFH